MTDDKLIEKMARAMAIAAEGHDEFWAEWDYQANAALAVVRREEAAREPDYCYDPENWECTCSWKERADLAEELFGKDDPREIHTLIDGPVMWVVDTPVTFDEFGDWDESERRWFRTREEAIAARDRRPVDDSPPRSEQAEE